MAEKPLADDAPDDEVELTEQDMIFVDKATLLVAALPDAGVLRKLADLSQDYCTLTNKALRVPVTAIETLVDLLDATGKSSLDHRALAARALRFCTRGNRERLDAAIQKDVIEKLVRLLKEAGPKHPGRCWATATLTGIMWRGDDHCDRIVALDAAECFVSLLDVKNPVAQRQGCQALGNMVHGPAGTGNALLMVDQLGVLPKLVAMLRSFDPAVREKAALVLRNIADCNDELKQRIVQAKSALTVLARLVADRAQPAGTLEQSLATLCNLCAGPTVDAVLETNCLSTVIMHLSHDAAPVRAQAAWTIANICGSGHAKVTLVIDHGGGPPLLHLLASDDEPISVKLQAAWAVANFTAGWSFHRRYLMEQECVPALLSAMATLDADVQVQAAWALASLSIDEDSRIDLVEGGVIEVLEQWLRLRAADDSVGFLESKRQAERALLRLHDVVGEILPPKAAV